MQAQGASLEHLTENGDEVSRLIRWNSDMFFPFFFSIFPHFVDFSYYFFLVPCLYV
jgi:hypothetical protein